MEYSQMIEWYWRAQHSWRAGLGVRVLQSAATPLGVTRSYTLGLHWNEKNNLLHKVLQRDVTHLSPQSLFTSNSRRTKVNRVHLRVAGSDCLPLSYCSKDPWDVAFCSSHRQVSQCWLSADLCWIFIVLHQSLLFQHFNDPLIFPF